MIQENSGKVLKMNFLFQNNLNFETFFFYEKKKSRNELLIVGLRTHKIVIFICCFMVRAFVWWISMRWVCASSFVSPTLTSWWHRVSLPVEQLKTIRKTKWINKIINNFTDGWAARIPARRRTRVDLWKVVLMCFNKIYTSNQQIKSMNQHTDQV